LYCAMAALANVHKNRREGVTAKESIGKLFKSQAAMALLTIMLGSLGISYFVFMTLVRIGAISGDFLPNAYWTIMLGAEVMLVLCLSIKAQKISKGSTACLKEIHSFLIAFSIAAALWILFYTTFLFNLKGFWSGVYGWYQYWKHLHSISRIRGPFDYQFTFLLIFAFLPFIIFIFGLFANFIKASSKTVPAAMLALWAALIFLAHFSALPWPLTDNEFFTNTHLAITIGLICIAIKTVVGCILRESHLRGFLL
jgi:hypothetical protein